VTLGAVGSSTVEIAQGLTDSDVVLSATGNSVAPGQRVSVTLPQHANAGPKN
jgi:hypothetical protein